ncbi:MAG: hypothetical protein QNK37_04600 [Acidobacteriota bacterium]|nr:hypothetical protein [Acidobacteriota bacterium]
MIDNVKKVAQALMIGLVLIGAPTVAGNPARALDTVEMVTDRYGRMVITEQAATAVGSTLIRVRQFDRNWESMGVIRLSASGEASVTGIAADVDGNVLVAGRFEGDLTKGRKVLTSGYGADVFMLLIDSEGRVISFRALDSGDHDVPKNVSVNVYGEFQVEGVILGTVDGAFGLKGFFTARMDVEGNTETEVNEGPVGQTSFTLGMANRSTDGTKVEDETVEPDGVKIEDETVEPDGVKIEDETIEPDGVKLEDETVEPDGIKIEDETIEPDGLTVEEETIDPDGFNTGAGNGSIHYLDPGVYNYPIPVLKVIDAMTWTVSTNHLHDERH